MDTPGAAVIEFMYEYGPAEVLGGMNAPLREPPPEPGAGVTVGVDEAGGCSCDVETAGPMPWLLVLGFILFTRRRR
jgi:MYXO-CTERM domain-containing protein